MHPTSIRLNISKARDTYALLFQSGGWFYQLGNNEPFLEHNLLIDQQMGSLAHNAQIQASHAGSHFITVDEVLKAYLHAVELGEKYGCISCFEVHVNMCLKIFVLEGVGQWLHIPR